MQSLQPAPALPCLAELCKLSGSNLGCLPLLLHCKKPMRPACDKSSADPQAAPFRTTANWWHTCQPLTNSQCTMRSSINKSKCPLLVSVTRSTGSSVWCLSFDASRDQAEAMRASKDQSESVQSAISNLSRPICALCKDNIVFGNLMEGS